MEQTGHRYDVDERLSGVLDHFYEIKLDEQANPEVHHLAPSLEMMMVFNFGSPVHFSFSEGQKAQRTIHKVDVIGPLRRMMKYTLEGSADLLVLAFTYNGLYRLLSLSIESLETETMPEDKAVLLTRRFEKLWETLSGMSETNERIETLTQYLVSELAENESAVLPLLDSVSDFHSLATSPVKSIAANTSLTERTVQLRFKKYVGYSPKELIRFLRFKQVLHTIINQPPSQVDWLELTYQYGYHDQSHLIKDFKYYTGVSPRQFLRLNAGGSFCINRE